MGLIYETENGRACGFGARRQGYGSSLSMAVCFDVYLFFQPRKIGSFLRLQIPSSLAGVLLYLPILIFKTEASQCIWVASCSYMCFFLLLFLGELGQEIIRYGIQWKMSYEAFLWTCIECLA